MKLNLQRVIFEFQEMAFSYAFGKNGGRIDGRCRAVRRHRPAFRRVGKARKGKVEAREGRPFEKEQKGTEMPGMQSPADARREKARRGRQVRMPQVPSPLFRRLERVAFVIEADAAEDQGDIDADNARLPLLGDRRDSRRKPKNGPVLVRQMPGRGDGMVDGIEAFRAPRIPFRRSGFRPLANLADSLSLFFDSSETISARA